MEIQTELPQLRLRRQIIHILKTNDNLHQLIITDKLVELGLADYKKPWEVVDALRALKAEGMILEIKTGVWSIWG